MIKCSYGNALKEMLLKLNYFQLTEQHPSWDSILIWIYRIDALGLENRNAHVRQQGICSGWNLKLFSEIQNVQLFHIYIVLGYPAK